MKRMFWWKEQTAARGSHGNRVGRRSLREIFRVKSDTTGKEKVAQQVSMRCQVPRELLDIL